jgi:hypothetical protein
MKTVVKRSHILHLTLNAKSFEVMVNGEKIVEYRQPSKWLLSRISLTSYDKIKFVNGYGSTRPFFVARYLGWEVHDDKLAIEEFSNGLRVNIKPGIIKIKIGEICEKGNIIVQK